MQDLIKKYKINNLFHFTDRSNLDSIKKHGGLYSIALLEKKGIKPQKPGGNDWSHEADRRNSVDKYVHLCFINQHPMQYVATQDKRITDCVWLEIDLSVLYFDSTRFTSDVANKSGVKIITSKQASTEIDFEALCCYLDLSNTENKERKNKAKKSEILVLDFIPLELIRNM